MRGSRNFCQGDGGGGVGGGFQVILTKRALTLFFLFFFYYFILVLSLFYRSQMVNFKEIYHFQGSRGGPTFSRGGFQLLPGGSNCLFPLETHITCDFPGGPEPLSPPLDPQLGEGEVEGRPVDYYHRTIYL